MINFAKKIIPTHYYNINSRLIHLNASRHLLIPMGDPEKLAEGFVEDFCS